MQKALRASLGLSRQPGPGRWAEVFTRRLVTKATGTGYNKTRDAWKGAESKLCRGDKSLLRHLHAEAW